ncbi:MAG: sialidase family protein [Alcanivoracaceae bacterium]|nr:sialidase family protein [Alcanivoracaceae bacterium]
MKAVSPAIAQGPCYGIRLWGATLLVAGLVAGCGGGDGRLFPAESKADGVFIDAPVQGLGYRIRGWSSVPRSEGIWGRVAMSADGSRMLALSQGAIWLSTDSGASWPSNRRQSPLTGSFFNEDAGGTGSVAVSADGQTIVVPQRNDSSALPLLVSVDGGETWVERPAPTSTLCRTSEVSLSADGQQLYFSGKDTRSDAQLWDAGAQRDVCRYRSNDAGLSWTALTGSPAEGENRLMVSADGGRLLAVGSTTASLSVDDGATWLPLATNGEPVRDAALSAAGDVVALATAKGVELHTQSGVQVSLTDKNIEAIAGSADMRILLAAEWLGKLYRSNDGGKSWSVSAWPSSERWKTAAVSSNGQLALATGGLTYQSSIGRIYDDVDIYVSRLGDEMRFTDANGGYRCRAGEQVAFYLGNFSLGSTDCAEAVHVYQLAGLSETPERGLRIAQLLQSLNTSGDPTRIVLPDLGEQSIDIDLGGTDEEFSSAAETLLSSISSAVGSTFTLVSKADAQAHVESEIIKLPADVRGKICSLNACNNDLMTQLAAGLQQLVGGTLTGLPEGAELKLTLTSTETNGKQREDQLAIFGSQDQWQFLSPVPVSATYTVTVGDIAPQFGCTVSNASGTMIGNNINNVAVDCTLKEVLPVTLGGTATGLQPSQSVTLSNGDDSVVVDANGEFSFPSTLDAGESFSVTINGANPSNLLCSLEAGDGVAPINYDSDVFAVVEVSCEGFAAFSLGGVVSGLPAGETLALQNTDSNTGPAFALLSANGDYIFADSFTGTYQLELTSVPSGLQCQLSSQSGSPQGAQVTVDVACQGARVTGIVNGLVDGASVQLSVVNSATGAQQIDLTGTGAGLAFNSVYMPEGATYDVTVIGTSIGTTCGAVTNGSGTIGTTNITNLSLECSFDGGGGSDPAAGSVGGTVTGLDDFDSVMIEDLDNFEFIDFLFNDSGQGGSFTMPSTLAPGTSYDITAQYTGLFGLTCSVTNGTGVMPAADAVPNYVNDIQITCE